MKSMPGRGTIVVVGAGVLGVTAALKIQEAVGSSYSLVIVARELPKDVSINYATPWAGAHYRPCPGSSQQLLRESVWAQRTYEEFQQVARDAPAAGVSFMWAEEIFENPSPEYVEVAKNVGNTTYAHLQTSFRILAPEEIGDPSVKLGFRYWTYCVNTPVYTDYLLRKFLYQGGQVKQHTLAALEEAFFLEKDVCAVVNCSGTGFQDTDSFIIRGQTCLVRNPISKTITKQKSDGTWSFAIPRPLDGGTIIGGTKEPHNWNPNPSSDVRNLLLEEAAKWFPFPPNQAHKFEVLKDIVGRRPARKGGLRLEIETRKVMGDDRSARQRTIVHAYGIGGRGVECSWGIADDILALLQEHNVLQRQRANL